MGVFNTVVLGEVVYGVDRALYIVDNKSYKIMFLVIT